MHVDVGRMWQPVVAGIGSNARVAAPLARQRPHLEAQRVAKHGPQVLGEELEDEVANGRAVERDVAKALIAEDEQDREERPATGGSSSWPCCYSAQGAMYVSSVLP